MKFKTLAGVLALSIATTLGGCTTVAQWTTDIAQNLSSSTPTQVATYADAVLAIDTFTRLADTGVNSGKLSVANLQTLSDIRTKVRAAYETIKAANAAGQSLDFAALNAALALWVSFATAQGISH